MRLIGSASAAGGELRVALWMQLVKDVSAQRVTLVVASSSMIRERARYARRLQGREVPTLHQTRGGSTHER